MASAASALLAGGSVAHAGRDRAPVASDTALTYHLVKQPIVVAYTEKGELPGFDVFFRLDHALPQDGAGLDAALDGVRAAEGVQRFVLHNRVCGRESLNATRRSLRLKRARPGSLVEFRIRVRATGQVLDARVRARPPTLNRYGAPVNDKTYAKALGCHGSTGGVATTSATRLRGR